MLSGRNILKNYGVRQLFAIEKLEIADGDRIGLVGANGAGKSTLLKVLSGEEIPDEGVIERPSAIGVIKQMEETQGVSDPWRMSQLMVDEAQCHSGGERTRRAIARALSMGAPLLLADEPTTNLDLAGIEAVEKLLMDYPGALVLVSHDHLLLDKLCKKIWALEEGKLRIFEGNYSAWLRQRALERDFAEFEYQQYRAEETRLQKSIAQVKNEAVHMGHLPRRMSSSEWLLYKNIAATQQQHVQSRGKAIQKRLERLPKKEKPSQLPEIAMVLGQAVLVRAKYALQVKDLTVAYGGRKVLDGVSFALPTGKRSVMLGANGAGKTTIIREILSGNPACQIANGVKVGYFAQGHEQLDEEKTALANARSQSGLPEHEVRSILINLGLKSEDLFKKVSLLSGGESAKVAFALLLASDSHLLILDEPTNHLDQPTTEALEALLLKWGGTLLVITHDRHLVQKIAQRLLFVDEGKVRTFEGNWPAYEEQLANSKAAATKDLALEKTRLQMEMAAVSSRLGAPQKGDDLQALETKWQGLLASYRTLDK